MESKACSRCNLIKPFTEFGKATRARLGITSECLVCKNLWHSQNKARTKQQRREWTKANPKKASEYYKRGIAKLTREELTAKREADIIKAREWALANPKEAKRNSRKVALWKNFKLTLDDYDKLLADQNGGCWICKGSCPTGSELSVDHCHKTGVIRGLLCRKCNSGIGFLNDDPKLVLKAHEYLTKQTTDEVRY